MLFFLFFFFYRFYIYKNVAILSLKYIAYWTNIFIAKYVK